MERESFESAEVADILNNDFISIKVDREERPDIDHIYMEYCQSFTGSGGWPLTIIMTPDKKPFFAGTYFPKHSKGGMNGLVDVLINVEMLWNTKREEVLKYADKSSENLKKSLEQNFKTVTGDEDEAEDKQLCDEAFHAFFRSFDRLFGGFGLAPKFPVPHNLYFLLSYWKLTGKEEALYMVEKTLQNMYRGGIWDHIGYGFSRYSTDESWLVPHFEKMLYDNALLLIAYVDTYKATKNENYINIAENIFSYIKEKLGNKDGGFFSSEDADSEGEEGKFYLWSKDEVIKILGEKDGEEFCKVYDISAMGNFEGNNIINLTKQEINFNDLIENVDKLKTFREKLYYEREQRIHPHKDDKILTAWNGLMLVALSKIYGATFNREYLDSAQKLVAFITEKLINKDERLMARYRDDETKNKAYSSDYVFLIWGLIELYEVTLDNKHLDMAVELNKQLIDLFYDKENGGVFLYGTDSEELLARPKEKYDGAIPSSNSVAILNWYKLYMITEVDEYKELLNRTIKGVKNLIAQYPRGYSMFLNIIAIMQIKEKSILIVGDIQKDEINKIIKAVGKGYNPNITLHKKSGNEANIYLCENNMCSAPTQDIESILTKIEQK